MGDWAKAIFKALRLPGQPDCDELAATTVQSALGNDGKNPSKKSFVAAEGISRQSLEVCGPLLAPVTTIPFFASIPTAIFSLPNIPQEFL